MLQPLKYKAVIFDMDGVIVDNQDYHHEAWMQFCIKHGLTVEGDVSHLFGMTNTDILQNIFPDDLSQQQSYEFAGEKEKLYRGLYEANIEAAPGVQALLESLSEKGYKLAIATSAPPENVDFVLGNTNLHIYFDVLIDSSMISKGKPDPEIYLLAAEKLNVSAMDCIVVEDSVAGIRSGKAAGMKVVAISSTNPRENLGEADLIIDDFNEFELPGAGA